MSDSVQMPALGESVTEGTVTRWLKQVGDTVDVDEPLLEVSTDKVDTEIPSPVAGVLQQILVSEDETVAVGTALAVIDDGSANGQPPQSEPAQSEPAPSEPARTEPSADRVQAESAAPSPQVDAPPVRPSSTEVEHPAERPRPQAEPAGGDGARVQMPALGESVTEGTVTRWLKQEGDTVDVDEPLLEVSTDKVDTEIPSPVAGVVRKILVGEDETVSVGADLAIVGDADTAPAQQQSAPAQQQSAPAPQAPPAPQAAPAPQAPPAPPAAPAPQAPPAPPAPRPAPAPAAAPAAQAPARTEPDDDLETYPGPSPAPLSGSPYGPAETQAAQALRAPEPPVRQPTHQPQHGDAGDASSYLTPLVRRLATEHGVDLSSIRGTGVGGRIRKQDVLDAVKAKQAAPAQAPAPAAAPAASGGRDVSALRGTTEKMSRLRRIIAQRMVESLQISAQLTTVVEVDVTKIARLRERAKRDFGAREGVKLSFLPFFALAAVEALKQYPVVNASIEGDQIVYHAEENLGVAVDTERGLLVPVIRNAGDLNIAGVARKIADLADRTRRNKITPDELGGGTFTLTNTGSRGAIFDTPIINQPQVAILGTGAVVKRPIVVTDVDGGETIAIRSMVYLALTYDHRLVDGADAARFLVAVKQRLEEGAFEADLGV
jgi:pyruvate dehydrogenase E2 component (dihydrolipoamide acetyltransferase)